MNEKPRILIVDDDDNTRRTLRMIFGGEGCETSEAATGREALAVAGRQPADLVLLDVRLPDMEGVELLAPLKALDPDIVVIIVTGNASLGSAMQALNQGALAYFTKPLDMEALLTRISDALEKRLLVRENRRLYQEAQRELTERNRAEQALRKSEEQMRAILNASSDAIHLLDVNGIILSANEGFAERMGLETDDVVGRSAFDYGVTESALARKAALAEVFRTGEPLELEDKGLDGVFESHVHPVFGQEGEVTAVAVYAREITERKRAEEERELLLARIRGQAQQLDEVMRTVPDGVLLLDARGQVILANPAAMDDLSILADAKAGDIITHLGDRPLAELLIPPPTEGLWHEAMGDNRTFEIIARPTRDSPGPAEWVLVIRDATQEREIQRRIQQQERLAAVGQLAAGIAHDFNNIMAVIVLYTQMELGVPDIPGKLRERLQTILHQADLATELIQQILDFGRRAVLERRPMDMTPFLKEVVRLLERTVPESIKIEFTHGTDEYTVNADPTRMQQVVLNLAVNARDAMPDGGTLSITLSRVPESDSIRCVTCGEVVGGQWISLAVTDTGSGIPPDVLPYIFEPFFTTKAPGQGTGLGLAQVHGIVTQHEGHIHVSSRMEEGTTFTYYLPALMVREVVERPRAAEEAPRGQGQAVLVVEDNAKMREALADILEMLNYQVMIAPNGRDALAILEKYGHGIALVLSDLVMPVMGGKALFYALREQHPEIRMVMLTGHPMEQELQELQAEGLSGYLLKPPSMEQLAQMVDRVLKG